MSEMESSTQALAVRILGRGYGFAACAERDCPIAAPNLSLAILTSAEMPGLISSLGRIAVLTVGPAALVAACYAVAAPAKSPRIAHPLAETFAQSARRDDELATVCTHLAQALQQQLPEHYAVIAAPPFVIAGDLPEAQLREIDRTTLRPTMVALQVDYFDRPPQAPITVLLCSDETSFADCSRRFHGQARAEYAGFYSRDERCLILNLATGEGTLAHELTHALAHVDFPDMPEWFDEGLASLHEESEFSDDGRHLLGLPNWRHGQLARALEEGRLGSLRELLGGGFARDEQAPLAYAYARGLCLFLQEQDLLTAYYRKLRTNIAQDATGAQSLCEVVAVPNLDEVDRQFIQWLKTRR